MPVIIIYASPIAVTDETIFSSATGLIKMPAILYVITINAIFIQGAAAVVIIVPIASVPAVPFMTDALANTISALSAKYLPTTGTIAPVYFNDLVARFAFAPVNAPDNVAVHEKTIIISPNPQLNINLTIFFMPLKSNLPLMLWHIPNAV